MKRFVCVTLVLTMLLAQALAPARAEGFFGSLGDMLDSTAQSVSEALDSAADGASDWLSQAGESLGDVAGSAGDWLSEAGDALSGAADEAGQALGGFLSDAGTWAEKTLDSASAWAVETWDWAGKTWEQVSDQGQAAAGWVRDTLTSLQEWMNTDGADTLEKLRAAYDATMEKLGVAGDRAEGLWEDLKAFSEEKGVKMADTVKIALAVLVRQQVQGDGEDENATGSSMDETVMKWIREAGIDNEEDALRAIDSLERSLETALYGGE